MQRVRTTLAIFLAAALAAVVAAQTTASKVHKGSGSKGSKVSSKSKSPKSAKSGVKRKSATTTAKAKASAGKRSVAKARAKTSAKSSPPRQRGQLRPTPERYKEIEQALAARGYLNEEPTGKWGEGSVEALRAFQADHQLPPTGKLDSLSLIQLGLGPRM